MSTPPNPPPVIVVSCAACQGELRRQGASMICVGCCAAVGPVLYANMLGAERRRLATKPDPKPTKKPAKRRRTKVERVNDLLEQPDLAGRTIQPGSRYRDAEKAAARRHETRPPVAPVQRLGNVRCAICDRVLVITSGYAVCPGCAEIDTSQAALAALVAAFPGAEIVS